MEDALLLAVLSLFSFIIFRLMEVKMNGDDHIWQYPDAALLNCSFKGEGLFVLDRVSVYVDKIGLLLGEILLLLSLKCW